MAERIIQVADLNKINQGLNNLNHNMNLISDQVNQVNSEVEHTQSQLQQLIQEFHEYVRKDQLQKNIQLAETRLVKIRQEIETKFGHYAEVRRKTTGILQAVDHNLVKKETIENITEEDMLSAPGYWLAPALIALASWLNDNKSLAERAMLEALHRDDEKTSLFFALVTRRASRYGASREWLDRYFGLQDPHALEREIVILIDGFANGVFGPDARIKTGKQIEAWIEELAQKAGFVEKQREQWNIALNSKIKQISPDAYPYASQFSPTWTKLKTSLESAKLHQIIFEHFSDILDRDIVPSKSIAIAVDSLLDTLVSKFDDEELPLKREERLYTIIVNENGDRDIAQNKFDGEKTFEERVSFTQLLTNFAMHPEVSNASLATQKLSIALSKDWIIHAHNDLTATYRSKTPQQIEIEIEGWKGSTHGGENERELSEELNLHIEQRKQDDLSNVKLKFSHWAGLGAGIIFTFFGFTMPFLFVFAAFFVVQWFMNKRNVRKQRDRVSADYDHLKENCLAILRATIADIVEWRKAYMSADNKAIQVNDLLQNISSEQYSLSSHDMARTIVRT